MHRTAQAQTDAGRGQLRRHPGPRPHPGGLAVPQSRTAAGQTRCGQLGIAGTRAPVFVGLGQTLAQGALAQAFDAVLQHPAQAPVLGAQRACLREGLRPLKRGLHSGAGDAREHIVVRGDMGCGQAHWQARSTSTQGGRGL